MSNLNIIDRKNTILEMFKNGLTYQAIGNIFGISRQRIHQLLTGYQSPSSKEGFNGVPRILRKTIRAKASNKCQICFRTEAQCKRLYDRRLDVHHQNGRHKDNFIENLMLLCRQCHAEVHMTR